jgi:hypothetical protein
LGGVEVATSIRSIVALLRTEESVGGQTDSILSQLDDAGCRDRTVTNQTIELHIPTISMESALGGPSLRPPAACPLAMTSGATPDVEGDADAKRFGPLVGQLVEFVVLDSEPTGASRTRRVT